MMSSRGADSGVVRVWRAGAAAVAAVAVVATVLVGCAGTTSGSAEPIAQDEIYGADVGDESEREKLAKTVMQDDRPPLPRELEAIRDLMREAEEIRGLPFVREFQVRIQTEKAIADFVRAEIDERRLKRGRDTYVALGLLAPEVTGAQLMEEASRMELQGYYDPTYQRLVLRDDVAMGLGAAMGRLDTVLLRSVVLHELVHALQDQHFGLEKNLFSRRSTDGHHAFMALMEGDATLAMMRYQVARMGLDFEALLSDQPLFDRIFSGLPAIHGVTALDAPAERRPEVFRYSAGALLAGGLMRHGGHAVLNRAFSKPPPTTRQVMDYGLYLDHFERPTVNRIPAKLLGETGHELLHEDSMGRVELSSFLSAGGAGGDILASGWQADRLLVFRRNGQLGSVWVVVMEAPEQAGVVMERGEVAVGGRTRAAGGRYDTLRVLDAAVLMRNVDPDVAPRLKNQLEQWLMSDRAVARHSND